MTVSAITPSTRREAVAGPSLTSAGDGSRFAAMLVGDEKEGATGERTDFTHITPRALRRAVDDLVADGRAGAQSLAAAVELVDANDDDTPINMIAYLRHEAAANEKAPGGMDRAFRQKAALAVLVKAQRDAGVTVVYDQNFPTAPRELTAEEVNLKLKQAIEAFRKEADLTPTQRLAKKLRADVMKDMRVTEESLKAMPPAERDAMEKKINDEVARKMALLGFAAAGGKDSADGQEAQAELATAVVASDDSQVKSG